MTNGSSFSNGINITKEGFWAIPSAKQSGKIKLL